ncbi:MAG: gluconeogenesis factor YvcK family protein, partial [Bacilli bacterium]
DKINIVCIGGGSGLSHFVKGIKNINNIDLKCIVTVADDGGNSGLLKEELNIPAVGDIRNVLVSLANIPKPLAKMMNHRFDKGSLKDHCLGNLVLASLFQTNDSIVDALADLSQIFNVSGSIIPSTLEVVDIKGVYEDNSEIIGESNISLSNKRIKEIKYISKVSGSIEAVNSIMEADLIIYSIGSLYTSLIPNLIIPEIKTALHQTKASKIYFSNLMSEPGETDNYQLSDFIKAINDHLGFNGIDLVIANNQNISARILELYKELGSYPIEIDYPNIPSNVKVMKYDVAKVENDYIIHSPEKILRLFERDYKCLFQVM